jgi:hypothetical protein
MSNSDTDIHTDEIFTVEEVDKFFESQDDEEYDEEENPEKEICDDCFEQLMEKKMGENNE